MKYRTLGRTGLMVSEIGFGAWAIGGGWGPQSEKESIAALHRALDLGVNFIDTAAGYGEGNSERIIAKVLKERSEKIIVATKTPPAPGPWPPTPYCKAEVRYSEKYLRENIEARLKNLGVECLDILQLHTWTRAWNKNPAPLEILQRLKHEGKIRFFGISTPEHDQNSLIDLMRRGELDVVQIIFNIFEQEPIAELLPAAAEHNLGVIVRVALDEGVLTGKYDAQHVFPAEDFRSRYFAGDRLARAVERVARLADDMKQTGWPLTQSALKFALAPPAVSTVIAGMRTAQHADMNAAVSDLQDLPEDVRMKLREHAWRRGLWYAGK